MLGENEEGRRLEDNRPKNIDNKHKNNIANLPKKASADLPIVPGNGVPDMRTLAVALARKGYHVFQLQRDSKLPLARSHAHLDATNDPGQVHKQWTAVDGSPKHWNIGIRGKGLLILDFDPKAGQTIAKLVAAFTEKYGKLPGSAVVKTPRGGRHLYLRCPEGMRVPNSLGKLLPDVDVRGENGYVVGPGSHTEASPGKSTATGNYTRPDGAAIDDFLAVSKLTEAPPWLIEVAWRAGNKSREWGTFLENNPIAPPLAVDSPEDWGSFEYPVDTEAQIAAARAWLRSEAPEAIEGQGGREATKQVIHWLGDAGLTYKTAMPLLYEEDGWDAAKCFPPWSASTEEWAKLDRLVRDLLSPKHRDRPIGSGHGGPPAGPRERAEDVFENEAALNDDQRAAGTPATRVTFRRASDITPESISWLWKGWLARGKHHILAGVPGAGKTTIAMSFAATISSGGKWPDGTHAKVGNVLVWTSEDNPTDTLVPRLTRMGADLTRIYFIENFSLPGARSRPFNPATDMRALVETSNDTGDIAMLILDPAVAAMPMTRNSHNDAESRNGMQPVLDFAKTSNAAVLGIGHLTKGTAGKDPLERLNGSGAFGAVARLVMGAAKNGAVGEDEPERIFVRIKSNNTREGDGFGYNIEEGALPNRPDIEATRIVWEGPLKGEARELLAKAELQEKRDKTSKIARAMQFLETALENGERPQREIVAEAEAVGITKITLRRAAEQTTEKHKIGERWHWRRIIQPPANVYIPPGADGVWEEKQSPNKATTTLA